MSRPEDKIAEALDKTVGQRLIAAGTAGLIGLAAAMPSSAQAPVPTPEQQAAVAPKEDFGDKPEDRFLWSIMQLESSGGRNTRHRTIKTGLHAGKHAMGRWGLMPDTVKEITSRAQKAGKSSGALDALASMDHKQMDKFFRQNPTVELTIARKLAQHVLRRQGYNPEKAAYAWNHGHNLLHDELPSEDVHESDYVKKFLKVNKLNPIRPKRVDHVKKSDGSTFRERFHDWKDRRDEEAREPSAKDRTWTQDPGRVREAALDEKDQQAQADATADLRGKIKGKIRDASESYGGGKPR